MKEKYLRRIFKIKNIEIKYIDVFGKLYQVININFADLILEAKETSLKNSDVAEENIFKLSDFKEFKVRLQNYGGNVINFAEYVKNRGE